MRIIQPGASASVPVAPTTSSTAWASVVAVTDASGNVTNSYTYDPYGVTTETTSSGAVANPWRYTGQYQDTSTGLYKMGARYYQPELGRWSQPDPSGQDANAYAYAASDPINNSDPTGLYCVTGKNPNGSCRSIARAVERAFVPPEGCAIFRYSDGGCFGGNFGEVLDRAFDRVGGLAAIPVCAEAASKGAALGGAAGAPAGGVGAVLGAPTGALVGCVGALGLTALFNMEFVQ